MLEGYDLMIIGAGPAGLSAGLYAGRFRLKTLLLEKLSPGGQLLLTPSIENYPGFPGGVSTAGLIEKISRQVESLGLSIENQEALGLEATDAGYKVKTDSASLSARALIISSGASPKPLGIKAEERLIGRGVSYCGTCDGPLFKGKEIAVVGGGDRALEEAVYLSGYAAKVTLIHRRPEFRASEVLAEKAKINPKVNFILESVVEEILGETKVEGLKIKNLKTNQMLELSCAGVFIFAGIKPNTNFLQDFLNLDKEGFVITDGEMQTSRLGVFACGDCRRKSLYQVITACSDGAVAAASAHKYLLKQ